MIDINLRQNVIDELDFEPSIDASGIGVAVENGVVTLTGHVSSYAEKMAAERAAERVRGVRAVAQEIKVRYPGDKKTSDDQIAERALAILSWDAEVPRDSIKVKVESGWVTLTGDVKWQYQRYAAEAAIRKLSGVVGVANLIEVSPHVQAENVRTKIQDAFKRNAELKADAIRVVVAGDRVTLEGNVKTFPERVVAENAAWSVPGVTAVEDRLVVS
jgi:osmotically-inducible protein OsmY